jgi:hypothetical protein
VSELIGVATVPSASNIYSLVPPVFIYLGDVKSPVRVPPVKRRYLLASALRLSAFYVAVEIGLLISDVLSTLSRPT